MAVMTSVDYGNAEVHAPDHGHEGSASDEWARKLSLKLMRFKLPLGCMITDRVQNLVVAGRCASVTHEVPTSSHAIWRRPACRVRLLGRLQPSSQAASWNRLPVETGLAQLERDDGVQVSVCCRGRLTARLKTSRLRSCK